MSLLLLFNQSVGAPVVGWEELVAGVTTSDELAGVAPGGKIWGCDFDPPVSLTAPFLKPPFNDQWWQDVDNHQPLPGTDEGFQLQVQDSDDPNIYIRNTLLPSPVSGGVGYVLKQEMLDGNPLDPAGPTRSNWFFELDVVTYGAEWTQKSRVWLQPDLLAAMDTNGAFPFNFRQIWECKMGTFADPDTSRVGFGVVYHNPNIFWFSSIGLDPPASSDDFESSGVILGEWFEYEAYLKIDPVNGRFTTKINGVIHWDYIGQTCHPPVDANMRAKWKIVSLYSGADRMTEVDHYQYVDKAEIFVPASSFEREAPSTAWTERQPV